MADYFSQNRGALTLVVQGDVPNEGFRPGQVGALYAVLAHFSVHEDPAILCLPTGYGKTSVMMALPMLLGVKRVLVIEPSDALRRQVSSHFRELSTLRRIGVIDPATPSPAVLKLEGKPENADAWRAFEDFDVVVSTPGSSSPAVAPDSAADLFDLVIFDEAHHAPADTWAAYLEHYRSARFVFLTATPFRRDGRVIPGKLAYRYPVMKALEEGAFQPITVLAAPVEDTLDDEHVDKAIAELAVRQLRSDTDAGYDHRLFVRAATISAARALVPLYQGLGVNVEAIDSKVSKRTQDDCERRLISGELRGIVCVDMFGEGYDFPKLKIAALHAPHRSLVPTIQFIGRFARVDGATGKGTLIAPLARVQNATAELLKEGVDLARMIDDAAAAELAGDAEEQALLERLPVRRIAESDYDAVSPLVLELYAHVRVFHCSQAPDFSAVGDRITRHVRVMKQWSSDDGTVSLLLTADDNPPSWATSDVLSNIRHDAFLFIYYPATQRCYIGSTRRTEKIYLGLMNKVCTAAHRGLSYEETSRARAGLQAVKFYNVGLKNNTFNSQAETYRTLTGPAAERAVNAGDGRAYSQGHFFGSGMVGEAKETVGASSSSRIWSNQRLTVSEFLNWVGTLDARLTGNAPFEATQLDLIRAATTLRQLPDTVIAGTWPKAAFRSNPKLRCRPRVGTRMFYRRLTDWELCEFDPQPLDGQLLFSVTSEDVSVRMRFAIGQGNMVSQLVEETILDVESAVDSWMPLADWLSEHPPIFYAADKSSFEGMNLMAAPHLQARALAEGDAEVIDWNGCDVTIEFLVDDGTQRAVERRALLAGRATVQEHLEQHLLAREDVTFLFYDHRSGEAADYIAVSAGEHGDVSIALYHCKGAGGPPGGGRVGDVYEVAGQMVKSVYYCDAGILLNHMEDRMNARYASPSRFLRGNFGMLRQLIDGTLATKLSFIVVGVQPGIRRSMVNERLVDLMVFGIDYARQGGAANAYWLTGE
ncbi:Superfamily II DNA or RNA helicase [Burkholderia sp. OK233]|nr:Superfamily II DNA or RNA helicase [Burkholderia sp. OK233]